MPSNNILINNAMEYNVPDRKMDDLLNYIIRQLRNANFGEWRTHFGEFPQNSPKSPPNTIDKQLDKG